MHAKVMKTVVGILGLGLAAMFLFIAVSTANVLDYAKSAMAVLVTLKLISLLGKKGGETQEATVATKRNAKLMTIGVVVGLLLPLMLLWLITRSVR